MKSHITAKFRITESFKITWRGLVFTGQVVEGDISRGDFIEFPFKVNGNTGK